MIRIQYPTSIYAALKEWREGYGLAPQSFSDFHQKLAEFDLPRHEDWRVLEKRLVDDGWGDGMQLVEADIAVKENDIWVTKVIRWHTSGAWFTKGAGWSWFVECSKDTSELSHKLSAA